MIQIKQYLKVAKLMAGNIMKSENEDDRNALEQWLNESVENKGIYRNIKEEGWYPENKDALEQFNVEKGWLNIQSRINSKSRTVKLYPNFYKYAAAAILVIALASTYFLRDSIFNGPIENTAPTIVNNKIEKGTDKATLTLEDGSKVILEKGSSYQAKNARSNGEQIIYQPQSSPESSSRAQSRDNTLTIPRGGEFFVQLSDGTKVWLNSETQLKYPVVFIEGKTRQVELIYGEAYFEVSPSAANKGTTFKVFNKAQEIEVLGTEFNIKAYKDESNIYTTLVEGKVSISAATTKQLLVPNQQSNLDITTNRLSINKINARGEIAWVNGEFILEGKNLKEIMKVLSRWYDMEVSFANKDLENERFIGVLGKEQNIVEILNIIKSFGVIKDYEINNKHVMLK